MPDPTRRSDGEALPPSEPEKSPAAKPLAERIAEALKNEEADAALQPLLRDEAAADITVALENLEPEQCERIFEALEHDCAAEVLTLLAPERAREIVETLGLDQFRRLLEDLPPRDAALVAAEAPEEYLEAARRDLPDIAADAEIRAAYPEGSAGRLMTNRFLRLRPEMTVAEALGIVRDTDPSIDVPSNLYAVGRVKGDAGEERETLEGVLSIRALAMADPGQRISELMATDMVTVTADADDDDAANLLSTHKFSTLPALDRDGFLVGVIPGDDLMHVLVARMHRRYSRAVGTDAQAMEDATPLQAAKIRVPWLLGTMLLELGAGLVIAHYNDVLERVILLASFMPVISAVAGNVGLQTAAITVRALDTGQVSLKHRGAALLKETYVTILMGALLAAVLGGIGMVWSKDVTFALVIAIALGCSMLTAAVMGTMIPMISKKLGFDPATTAGPFETAFQDIIGFGVFLALATLML